jgi:flagellar biosynthesis/type III secretory pathway protein FliH
MDTETVLEIIAMLDARLQHIEKLFNGEIDEDFDKAYECGKRDGLEEIRDHLQGYIESLVAQVEGT